MSAGPLALVLAAGKKANSLGTARMSRLFIVWLSVSTVCCPQQFRQEEAIRQPFSKTAIERRLQSKHPERQTDHGKPVPGAYLLGRAAAREAQLKSRIFATSRYRPQPHAPQPEVLPGIQFRNSLTAGALSNSVITGDFNRDGHPDFVVANGGTDDLWIYFGKGDGTFELPRIIPLTKGETPIYLVTADLRGTGVLDLVVAEFDTQTIGVLLGNGDGTFGIEQEYLLPQPPGALVVDDFNHDGKMDIVSVMVTLSSDTQRVQYLATLIGDGSGSFGAPAISMNPGFYSTAGSIVSGDVNNDGLPDVLITGPGLENSQVYLNAGNGTFVPGATLVENFSAPGAFNLLLDGRLADLNGDGCLDAAIADGNSTVWILAGDCSGNFSLSARVPMGDSNSSVRIADLNGDGHMDIVTTSIPVIDPIYGDVGGNSLSVAFGDGRLNFSPARDYVGTGQSYSSAITDFNGDGKPDIVSVSPDTDTASVYLNDGSGGFGFPQGAWLGLPGVGVVNAPVSAVSFADVNSDGKPDVVLLDEGVEGEYYIATMLNDGAGRFSGPNISDIGITIISDWMGDYRLGDFRKTGHPDFVGIGLSAAYSSSAQYILFAPGNNDGTFGKATFTPAPGADGEMTVGDFNLDGKLDFVAVGPDENGTGKLVTVFLGDGTGAFRNAGSMGFADSAEDISRVFTGDFNRDGKSDVLVYTTGNGYWTPTSNVWEFLGKGDGTFQPGQKLFSSFQPMAVADVNGDSWPDIIRYDFFWPGTTEAWGPAKFTTYLSNPSGSVAQSSSYSPYAGEPFQAKPYLQNGDPLATSKVADLNGDGKPDEVAFQAVSPMNGDDSVYAQILMGNGDGTFTPTYDVFAFNKSLSFPGYAHDLDGDGSTDLLELDGATSSMRVFKGSPASAFQLVLEESQVTGSSGCGWIFLDVPSATDTNIRLSSSVSGVLLPSSVTVPAGSLNQKFCYTLDSTFDWHQVFDVKAQLGNDTEVAQASGIYVVGFSETVSPNATQVIYPGQSTVPVTLSLTSSQGYTSTVQLTCGGLLAGETCTFGSTTLTVSPASAVSTTVVVNTSASTEGGGPVFVIATDVNVTRRQSFDVTLQPLIVDAVGSLPPTTSPGTATGMIMIVGLPPYKPSCSGLPLGVTCAFSGKQLQYPSDTDLSLTLTVPSGVAPGAYPFKVEVVSGSAKASADFTMNISDFTLQPPSAASDWAPPGGTVEVIPSVTGFGSLSQTVSVTCTLDFGGTCTGGSFQMDGSTSSPIDLAVSVPSGVSLGTHTLTVIATIGSASHTATFPFYVADYSGSLSSSTLTITRGSSGSLTAVVNATAGFGGTLSFACAAAQVTCAFTPSTVQPTENNPQTTNLTITAGNSARNLPFRNSSSNTVLPLALILPFGSLFTIAFAWKIPSLRLGAGLFLLALVLTSMSCGGGSNGNGGGGSGSNGYTLTVSATAAGTNTTRALGTIRVTVTH